MRVTLRRCLPPIRSILCSKCIVPFMKRNRMTSKNINIASAAPDYLSLIYPLNNVREGMICLEIEVSFINSNKSPT